MSPDPRESGHTPSEPPPDEPPPGRAASYAPKLAVLAVAGAAVTAAFMGTRPDTPAESTVASAPQPRQEVVRAPPLVVTAPPLKPAGSGQAPLRADERAVASAMGAAPACGKCGVVESVLAARPSHNYQMRIRMDDGSLRTVEQRGALAAGTRVVVEGESVRLMPG